jgi:hypothetical protein
MISSKLYYRSTLGAHNAQCQNFMQSHWIPCDPTTVVVDDSTEIVCQIEGSESLHLSLESDPNCHTMSLLVSGTTLCPGCVTALSAYQITSSDNMWSAGKKLAAIHIELRPTRF